MDTAEKSPTDFQMDKLKSIASEHFDEYLLVVTKDKQVWNTYKTKTSAYGMASMIVKDIENDWNVKVE